MAAYLQERNMSAVSGAPRPTQRPRSRSPGNLRQQLHQQPQRSSSSQRRRQQDTRRDRPSFWQHACALCQDDHALSSCRRFINMSPCQRYETVERRSYCPNCLAKSHLAPDCTSLTSCHKCDLRHHTLLHGASQIEEPPQNIPETIIKFTWDLVFVPTAMVRVVAEGMETYATLRALILQRRRGYLIPLLDAWG
ncbi:uncharacterized protein [Musca autumnalis]|uniref:uncharacterized protein n=1 Tax=Musca autumnalis TaxID=221902 RepID=UPI003CEB8A16